MIYITGDTHARFDRIIRFCERVKPKPSDTMIILGDAGFNYYGDWRDQHNKELVSRLPLTVFSIHGNHEERPNNIPSYRTVEWNGGRVYVEDAYPNLLFAVDGEIYDLNGQSTIVIGGAYSIDKPYRLAMGWHWWPDEQPTPAVKQRVEEALAARGWKVDAVLSHTVPLRYEPTEVFMTGVDQSLVDKTTETWLGEIEEKIDYGHWYAGHYHTNKDVDRMTILFEQIREWPSSIHHRANEPCHHAEGKNR